MSLLNEKQADAHLFQIAQKLGVLSLIKPLNLQAEKERFFSAKKYNPQFIYRIDFNELNLIETEIKQTAILPETWRYILLQESKEKFLIDLNLIRNIGGDLVKFNESNQKKYILKNDFQENQILTMAEKELSLKSNFNQPPLYDAFCVQSKFQEILKKQKIDWQVEISSSMVPLLSVKSFRKKIFINAHLKLSELQFQRMVTHEIETHLYRSLNGKRLFELASTGLYNYEKAGEGLAAYNESLIAPQDKSFLQRFYVRYQSILFAQQNSFADLFHFLQEKFQLSAEESWTLSVRTKRGLKDTSQAGAFLKDRIYLQGYYAVQKLTDAERRNLYKGKFSLEHLKSKQFNLNDDTLISAPLYLPDYLKINV